MFSFEDKLNLIKMAASMDRPKKKRRRRSSQQATLDAKFVLTSMAPVYATFGLAKQVYNDVNAARAMMNAAKVLKVL